MLYFCNRNGGFRTGGFDTFGRCNSYFIPEGKNMLIEEFGRDYGRYFDILKLIATGHNTRGDIEGIAGLCMEDMKF